MSIPGLSVRPDLFAYCLSIGVGDDVSDDYHPNLLEIFDRRFVAEVLGQFMECHLGHSSLGQLVPV